MRCPLGTHMRRSQANTACGCSELTPYLQPARRVCPVWKPLANHAARYMLARLAARGAYTVHVLRRLPEPYLRHRLRLLAFSAKFA
jgi:hypothetical protein